ncbi:MAG: amidophosphoribosyltransferase [Gemmatimonadetes bacterium GWC2_71_10]|nr:MAG: amidophosphoribosyltransferase [Gemmatimonadetes bacterium GWC2_71_10]
MCGIFGVSGHAEAAHLTYLGLYALQHRGQEAAGIVSVDDAGVARAHKGNGLVADVFHEDILASLDGATAIGHTRYSTAGGSAAINTQPFLVRYRMGTLAIAHNGNLTNAGALRRELVEAGSLLQSTADTEALIHLIARSQRATPEEQIREAVLRAEGAYSLLVTVNNVLYALVDPRGFRPLMLGRVGDATCVASESCALDIVGARVVCELEPGSFVRIEQGQVTYLDPLPARKLKRCVFELVYFSRPDSMVFGESVNEYRRRLGRRLAQEHPAPSADCVFSVPDSSNAAALGFSEVSGIALEHALIRNHYVGRTFIHPSQAGRDAKVRIKYNAVREIIAGRSVVVVDDSIVRGTTSRGLVSMIRQAGAREVHFRVASPPNIGPCYYGIDTPTREELIASTHSVADIRRYLGVESLGYLSLEGMLQASAGDAGRFCHACFSNEYPTDIPADATTSGFAEEVAR